ncbi:MAG: hypothetical protein IT290_11660, partial [Deltaproteobacteria bacterium]|nr:hypothetical protein [Deltaproteobacteria bacterium]
DRAHIDRAQFSLPASDLVIEYEYRADAPLKVMLDQSLLEELPAETSGWSRRVILSRDIASGVERRLVFDNPDFPRAPGKGGPLKQWGVRDARVTPMTRDHTSSFDALLNTAIVTSEKIRVTPDGMYNFLRLLQRLTLEGMRELNLDSLPYEISPALEPPDPVDIRLQLDSIRNERARNLSSSSISSHMNLLTKIVASLDSELWRKVSISLLRAEREASVKQYIEAYDILTGIQEMFPEREERRWVLAEALLSNKKIVPTRVRKNPNKFRKK